MKNQREAVEPGVVVHEQLVLQFGYTASPSFYQWEGEHAQGHAGLQRCRRLSPRIALRSRIVMNNRVEIHYCTQCRWLTRAAWMAQELLLTFDEEITELALCPGTGGVFEVIANGESVWSRKAEGRFPEITELKQRVRDVIAPGRNLGHSDKKPEQ
jgi:selenoprotein W-related protein